MKVIDVFQRAYPSTIGFLSQDLPSLNQSQGKIWSAFLDISGLPEDKAAAAVACNGENPLLWFTDLGATTFGYFDFSMLTRISLSRSMAQQFEIDHGLPDAQMFLRVITLHELCNWARGTAGPELFSESEPGIAFEARLVTDGVLTAQSRFAPWWQKSAPAVAPAPAPAADLHVQATARADYLTQSLLQTVATTDFPGYPPPPLFTGADVARPLKRGIRNNNPGNVRQSGSKWLGLTETSDAMTDFQREEQSFCVFREPEWGIRCMAYIIRKHAAGAALPLRPFISSWAPMSDGNQPESYAAQVSSDMTQALGRAIAAGDSVDVADDSVLISMIMAMGKVENGVTLPYAPVQYLAALRLLSAT